MENPVPVGKRGWEHSHWYGCCVEGYSWKIDQCGQHLVFSSSKVEIIWLGEAEVCVALLHTLSTLPTHPESVPTTALFAVKGSPLEDQKSQIKQLLRTNEALTYLFDVETK
ncbi:hypothetical protein Fmac_022635 [Flemingia macrophylla]|uniref:Uncharacterized protein n=1 Tax=Flemingia macrophylla TaxID=520843 RepID=A0ABD1M0W5_9FABA